MKDAITRRAFSSFAVSPLLAAVKPASPAPDRTDPLAVAALALREAIDAAIIAKGDYDDDDEASYQRCHATISAVERAEARLLDLMTNRNVSGVLIDGLLVSGLCCGPADPLGDPPQQITWCESARILNFDA